MNVKNPLNFIIKKKDSNGWTPINYPPKSLYKLFGFLPIRILVLLIILISEIFIIGAISEQEFFRKTFFQLIFLFLTLYCPIKTILYYKKIIRIKQENEDKNIENSLIYVISSNKLYDTKKFDIEVNRRIKSQEKIVNSIQLWYKQNSKNIFIRAQKFGDRYNDVVSNLGSKLSSSLGYPLESLNEDILYVDYIFKKQEDTRLILKNSDTVKLNTSDEIFLTEQLSFRLSKQPHTLISGVTGGGKTTLINYLILELLRMKSTLFVLDNKNSDLANLRQYLGNDYVGTNPNESAKITRLVSEEMEQRFKTYKENPDNFIYGANFLDYHLKPIVLIVDELGALRASADKKVFSEIISNLTNVVLKGREMGVFVILSTQQPNSSNIPTELRDNLSVRISLGNLSDEAYRMCFNEVPEETVQGVGEGFVFIDGKCTKPQKIQFPYVDYKTFNFIEELKKIQKLINENERR